jgi:hypothetical protein
MAGIDKIYGTQQQYEEFYLWCESNLSAALMYFYEESNFCVCTGERMISNFPEWIDKHLLQHCDIEWVIDYIEDQYGINQRGKDYKNRRITGKGYHNKKR